MIIDFPDMKWLFIDATYVKAHQHSSSSNMKEQGINKSIAGNISKIHLAVDARDNSISFIVTDDVVVLPPDMRS